MTVRISLDLPTHLYMQHEVVQRTSHKTFSPRYRPHPLLRTSIKPAHFHTRREGFGQLHIQLLSRCTGYCGPIRRQYSVMWYVAAPKIRIMTKCGIDNDINCQSRSVENCLWEEYEHLKEEQALASETERKVALLLCWLDRLQQKLLQYMFAFWHFSNGSMRHCPGCHYSLLLWRTR